MKSPPVIGALLICFLLSGCLSTDSGAGPIQPGLAATPGAALYTGPPGPNEIRVLNPFLPHSLIGDAPFSENAKQSYRRFWGDAKSAYMSEVVLRRVGDAIAWRVLMQGPDVVAAQSHPGADGGAFDAEVNLTSALAGSGVARGDETLHLGAFALSQMQRVQTARGEALDTGWIWSPFEYEKLGRTPPEKKAAIERLWARAISQPQPLSELSYEARRTDERVSASLRASWHTAEWLQGTGRQANIDRQLYGQEALAALGRAGDVYADAFAEDIVQEKGRDAVIQWFDANFVPVAPYSHLQRLCGEIPEGWQVTSLPSARYTTTSAQFAEEAARLDRYADCTQRAWDTFAPAPYAALYPQVLRKLDEWRSLGGRLTTHLAVVSDGFIRGYESVAPERVDEAFAHRIQLASNPSADARRYVSDALRVEARERAIRAEELAEERAREARRRAALQAQLSGASASGGSVSAAGGGGVSAAGGGGVSAAGGAGGGGASGGSSNGASISLTSVPRTPAPPPTVAEDCDTECRRARLEAAFREQARQDAERNQAWRIQNDRFVEWLRARNEEMRSGVANTGGASTAPDLPPASVIGK